MSSQNQPSLSTFSSLDIGVVTLTLLFSVNPFFNSYRWIKLFLLLIIFLRFLWIRRFELKMDKKIWILFFLVTLLALCQGIIWKFSMLSLITLFAFEFLTPYYLFKTYQLHFFTLLERVIFGLTLTVLIIWACHEIYHPFRQFLIGAINVLHPFSSESMNDFGVKRSLIFYTFMYEDTLMNFGIYRNSGFAHEPGGFAVFANLGLFISLLSGRPIRSARNLIYALAIISTFSTAGIIALFFISSIGLFRLKRLDLAVIVAIMTLPITYYIYTNTDFLGAKIEQQLEEQTDRNLNESTTGRLYGARKSIHVLSNHPLIGRGLLSVSKPISPNDPEFAAYGWLSDVSRYGVLIGFAMVFFFIRGFRFFVRHYSDSKAVLSIGILSLLVSLSSQSYLTNPIFFTFVFAGAYLTKHNSNRQAKMEKAASFEYVE
jgi:hypothetical protein